MLNRIILSQLTKSEPFEAKAMGTDKFEDPSSYKGWIYPLRYLLALRYLKQKQKVLEWFRLNKTYPVPDDAFKEALLQQLSPRKKQTDKVSTPVSALGFKALLVYPLLLTGLLFGLYNLNNWYQDRRIENVLANHLPYFSDLLHRKLIFKHNGKTSQLAKIEPVINKEQQKILGDLPEKNGIRAIMKQQLENLKDSALDSEQIMLGFKALNTHFDAKGLPYYLTPKSFSMPCSSLIDAPVEQMMMIKKMEELMSDNNPERCRTTMMTVYKVNQRGQLYYDETEEGNKPPVELPLFRVERVDKVPAIDSALGLTFKGRGIGSIILVDRIKHFAHESILPALTFQGRSYIIPFWMQGYYDIEEAITKGYQKDLQAIYPSKTDRLKVKSTVKKIIKNKNRMKNSKMEQTLQRTNSNSEKNIFGNGFDAISVLLGKQTNKTEKKEIQSSADIEKENPLLERLDEILLPSIEYHEAYHQIDKKSWKTPKWVHQTFKDELSSSGLDHTMEELGAYLSQLASTQKGQNIWLSKLLIFSLNPMTKGQAEYYASSIILTTMESLYLDKPVNPNYQSSVDDKTRIYKTLISKNNAEIRALAKSAYEILFERDVPDLYQ